MAGKKRRPVSGRTRRRSRKLSRTMLAAFAILAAIAVVFFLLSRGGGQITIGENAVGTALSPLQNAFTSATNWAINLIETRRNYQDLSDEYAALRRENDSLKLEIAAYAEESAENDRLTQLLGAYDRYTSLSPVYAKVIARDPGVWFDTFSINVGTGDGVETDMAVITGDGLIGRVYEVGFNYAKVLSLIDSRSAVACLVERTRDNGVLRGVTTEEYTTATCHVFYLPSSSDANVGDTVITSGVDTLYPKGIPIGTVSAVSRASDSAESYIVVSPHADFHHIEEVLVLRVQTEKDSEALQPLPTPTPRPTTPPSSLSLPTALPDPTPTPEPDDMIWTYPTTPPTAPPDPGDMSKTEDRWAE